MDGKSPQLLLGWHFGENETVIWSKRESQLVLEVERVVAGRCRVVPVNRSDGEMVTPQQILAALGE